LRRSNRRWGGRQSRRRSRTAAGDSLPSVLFNPLGAAPDGAAGIRLSFRWFVGIGVDDAAGPLDILQQNATG